MNLTNFSVKNYQFTLVIALMVAVVGLVTLLTMPRAEDPQIKAPQYIIVIVYPGTSPKDMEDLIVKKIENKVYELENIDKIKSDIQNGLAVIKVDFKYEENVDNKYQEVVREVNALKSDLPPDIYSIDIRKLDPTDVNILQLGLVSETASYKNLKAKADSLKDELEKIPELKKVKISGTPGTVVRIDLDLAKIAALKIPLNIVLGSLQSEALNIPAGNITAGHETFNVKVSEKFKTLNDIEAVVVFNGNGNIVLLKDVAAVDFKDEELTHITRLNGHRCVLIDAAQKSGGNISTIQKKYVAVISNFERSLPSNIKLYKNFDQADNVALRLSHLGRDFLIAILLVLITLLPLGTRASLIVMIAIPLSLALGLVGLNAFGISLNQLSIVGLVVALGLLVDDSIVVVENIERWLREGYSRRDAAVKATKQITEAVVGCTATLGVAFMPLIFLPGGPGDFVRGLPLAVICCVFASMLISLTIVPFLASNLLQEHSNPEGNVFLRALKRLISGTYTKLMHLCLQRPVMTLLIAFLLFGISLCFFPLIGFKLFPASEKPIFLINIKMPQQTSLQRSDSIAMMAENVLKRNKKVLFFTINVGKGNPQIYYNVPQQEEKANFAQIFVQMDKDAKPEEKIGLIEELRKRFSDFAYAKIEIKDFEQGPPIESPISIRIFGDNLDTLRKLSFKVEKLIRSNNGTLYVSNELNTLKTDMRVDINREKARTLGVLTADIDKTVRLAIAGYKVGTFTNDDKDNDGYDIIVTSPKQKFATLNAFKNLYINSASGIPIPLAQFASIKFETSSSAIHHFNKNRFVSINSSTKKGVLANAVLKDIIPKLNALKMPMGYSYKLSGEAENENDAFGGGFVTVILLTIFLFIAILILQFKTFKGILIVLSVIPLGVIGGVVMLWLSGNPMSFIAIIGFIGLAGIEVKNSILLVDFTNQLREQGVELTAAIEQAGETRFLPVVLTSLTAIGGLIPLALNPNPQISPLALVLIGGLISSTILSRIVTPVMYRLIPPKLF